MVKRERVKSGFSENLEIVAEVTKVEMYLRKGAENDQSINEIKNIMKSVYNVIQRDFFTGDNSVIFSLNVQIN